ncbi:hypothetical protein C1O66_04065 [Paucibacter aquatile]|uniref:DNA mimic protein DMP19 C-terminal domain-containing protein n=1 Tax=Kinneretia aquatilis TaxID=2070761 RepID=A0A2N8KTQ3_9BURK|nr:DUF4375 domain-containing protein [Paucibacter aquatile]PND36792.1 hypothetical protein C1O66_04065 [Paucibacter aquatile]
MLSERYLLECDYCGQKSPFTAPACVQCNRDYKFFTQPVETWDSDQLYRWLYSQHYQIYETVQASGGTHTLTEIERMNYHIGYLEFQVLNGGIHQYFFNPSGPTAPACVELLKKIKARRWAALLSSYLKAFPQKLPPQSMEERNKHLEAIPRWRQIWLDWREHRLVQPEPPPESLPLLLARYVASHRDGSA